MSTVPPTTPASHPNVPSTYHQVLATRGSSENTLRERESSKTGLDANADEERHNNKNDNGKDNDAVRHHTTNEDGNNDAEEKAQEGSLKPVGFWDPSLAKTRKWVLLHWMRTILILCVFILGVLSLYWGVLYHVPQNLEALTVAVVSFDGQVEPYNGVRPLVGQEVIRAAEMELKNPSHLGYVTKSPAEYKNDPMAVRQAVYDQHIWAALIVNANASALLQRAVETGDHTYDPMGAAQFIYNQARDETTYGNYIVPMITQLQTSITSQFGEMWASQVLSNTSLSRATLARAPQAISPAIGFSTYNLRPFYPYTATPAVSIGLIYLIIIAFFSFSFFLPIHTKYIIPQGHPPMHFYQLIIWRWFATLVADFFMSLAYSFVSLAFQIPFSNSPSPSDTVVANNADAFGKGTFAVYWTLNFVGMCALGLACENVAMVVGQPWTALWLIFWVITNVSTSFYAIELSPRFFHWGWAWPLQQIVTCSRTLIFGTHSRLGLNFGILFAWCAVNTALFPICCIFMRWKSEGEKAKRQGKPKPGVKELLE